MIYLLQRYTGYNHINIRRKHKPFCTDMIYCKYHLLFIRLPYSLQIQIS